MNTVWIVDDREMVSEFIARALVKKGYSVRAFSEGQAFLDALALKRTPNAVMLDLMMPNMNGFEVLAAIRERFDKDELPVMFLTASGLPSDMAKAIAGGANDYLTKPPRLADLYPRIAALCEKTQPDVPTIGPYHVLEKLGEGGMATVYRAIDTDIGMPVALKVMHAELRNDIAFRDRFRREADILMSVTHPHIVRFHGIQTSERGDLVLVMEHLDGHSADQAKLGLNDALRMTASVLRALDYLHARQLIHRDITPGNIMVTRDGISKVVDFGIAISQTAKARQTAQGAVIGTPVYLSPERFTGEIDPTTDAYALACVLYEILERGDIYDTDVPEDLVIYKSRPLPGLSADVKGQCTDGAALEHLLKEMTQPKVKKRPTDLAALADDFMMLVE